MLLALFRESDGNTEQQVNFDSLPQKHGVEIDKPNWVSDLMTEWSQQGIAHFPETGTGRHDVAMIDIQGVRNAEALDPSILPKKLSSIDHNVVVLHSSQPSASTTPTSLQSAHSSILEVPTPETHDSTKWTGAQFILVDAKVIAEVLTRARELREAVNSIRFESNVDSDNLKGLADALVAICLMAEPEVTIIDRILASPKFKTYVTLISIIAAIRGAIGI